MGSQTSAAKNGHYQLKGPKDNPEVRISKTQMLRDAADFGMVGLLNTGAGGDPNAITAPWAGLDSSGRDPSNALGTMWGDALGDAGGVGGLALTGIGEGGGGKFMGVGMGAVNTIGRGQGLGDGQGFGPGGHSGSRLGPGHKVTSPTVRTPTRSACEKAVIASPVAMKVLDGTQSDSTHWPPAPSRSTSTTSAPSCTATRAAS